MYVVHYNLAVLHLEYPQTYVVLPDKRKRFGVLGESHGNRPDQFVAVDSMRHPEGLERLSSMVDFDALLYPPGYRSGHIGRRHRQIATQAVFHAVNDRVQSPRFPLDVSLFHMFGIGLEGMSIHFDLSFVWLRITRGDIAAPLTFMHL